MMKGVISVMRAMSSTDPARPLAALCSSQHRVILQLLSQLSQATDWDLGQRRTAIQKLRQRLSRHIQLERHALYPLLRSSLDGDADQCAQINHQEQQLRDLLPQLTCFLHQAERSPQQLDPAVALGFYHQLRVQFQQEEQVLYPLLANCVSAAAEQRQLHLFRRRLQATLSAHSPASRSRRPSLEELERQAVTRPVLPGEQFRPNGVQFVAP